MDERARQFLETNHAAAMITLRPDGTPHVARVAIGLVDGKIWSSGTQQRLRTRFLRRDPRSTLFVFDASGPQAAWRWLGLETTVTILEGPDVPEQSLAFFRMLQAGMTPPPAQGKVTWGGQPRTYAEFLQIMKDEKRLLYEFEVRRTYGLY
jgi:hypothetical protein